MSVHLPLPTGPGCMTGEERVAYLVKLAMEAYDGAPHLVCVPESPGRRAFRANIEERMRQAAQAWQSEVDCAGDSK